MPRLIGSFTHAEPLYFKKSPDAASVINTSPASFKETIAGPGTGSYPSPVTAANTEALNALVVTIVEKYRVTVFSLVASHPADITSYGELLFLTTTTTSLVPKL